MYLLSYAWHRLRDASMGHVVCDGSKSHSCLVLFLQMPSQHAEVLCLLSVAAKHVFMTSLLVVCFHGFKITSPKYEYALHAHKDISCSTLGYELVCQSKGSNGFFSSLGV